MTLTPKQHAPAGCRARGYSMVEMVLSLTLLGIVMASVGSAVLFASQAVPAADSPTATLLDDAGILALITEDLAQAKYVTERNATAITIVVADRTDDGLPDTIRYAWTGKAGDPLTYSLNGGSPVAVLESAASFSLAYEMTQSTFTTPAAVTYADERLIAAFENNSGASVSVSDQNDYGQVISPFLPGDVLGFVPTSAQFYGGGHGTDDGQMLVEVRGSSAQRPTNTLYGSGTILETDLSNSSDWHEVNLRNAEPIANGDAITLLCSYVSGNNNAGQFRTDSAFGGLINSKDGGASWQSGGFSSLSYRLYGREITDAKPAYTVTRDHVSVVTVSLKSLGDQRDAISRRTRLLQAPMVLDSFWEADFSASPTGTDLNADGTLDWIHLGIGGLPDRTLVDGYWNASSTLQALPSTVPSGVIVVQARVRAQDNKEPTLNGPHHVDASSQALPLITVVEVDDDGEQAVLIYNESTPSEPIATYEELGTGWIDLRLTLLTDEDLLHVTINGVDRGSLILVREPDQGRRGFSLSGDGDGAQFNEIVVHVGGTYAADTGGGGLLNDLINNALNLLTK